MTQNEPNICLKTNVLHDYQLFNLWNAAHAQKWKKNDLSFWGKMTKITENESEWHKRPLEMTQMNETYLTHLKKIRKDYKW